MKARYASSRSSEKRSSCSRSLVGMCRVANAADRVCGTSRRATAACDVGWGRVGSLTTLPECLDDQAGLRFGIETPEGSLTRLFLGAGNTNEVAVEGEVVANRILQQGNEKRPYQDGIVHPTQEYVLINFSIVFFFILRRSLDA